MLVGMFMFSLVSATCPTHKQNTNYSISFTDTEAGQCNVTTIQYPDGTTADLNIVLSGNSHQGLIQAGNFSQLGETTWNYLCENGYGNECVEVTLNGTEPAGDNFLVFSAIIFILFIVFGIFYFLKALAHVIEFNMDILDVAIMMGTYFGLFTFHYFTQSYLQVEMVNSLLETAITIGAYTHVFLPIVGFLISFIMTNLKFKQKARITY
jgi:hypothetical protein